MNLTEKQQQLVESAIKHAKKYSSFTCDMGAVFNSYIVIEEHFVGAHVAKNLVPAVEYKITVQQAHRKNCYDLQVCEQEKQLHEETFCL